MGVEKKNASFIKDALKFTGKLSAALALLYSVSLFALNDEQKQEIRGLHKHTCQYPGCNREFTTTTHVHHIIPQGFSLEILGMSPDHWSNLVPICDWHHLGYPAFGGESPIGPNEEWNPIHPDNTFASLLAKGKIRNVNPSYKNKYPDIYQYYLSIAEEFNYLPEKEWETKAPDAYAKYMAIGKEMGLDEIKDIVYEVVMRKRRNQELFNPEKRKDDRIYWMPQHDPEMQIRAITAAVEGIKSETWIYPLRFFSSSSRGKTGQYVWDTMAALLVEKHVLTLAKSRNGLTRIFKEMRRGKKPSWQVYFDSIYLPAVRGYQRDMNMNQVFQNYIESLSESEYKSKVSRYNAANRGEEPGQSRLHIFNLLDELFYKPAVKYSREHKTSSGTPQPEDQEKGLRVGTVESDAIDVESANGSDGLK